MRTILLVLGFSATVFAQAVDLDRGHVEINGFAGAMIETASIFSDTKSGAGFGAAFGINRYIAATGDFSFGHGHQAVFCFSVPCTPPDENIYSFSGGLRLSLPNHTRITPYFTGTIGGLRNTLPSSLSSTEFAVGLGLGANIRVVKRVGILLDLRGLEAVSPGTWWVRTSAGVYFRF